MVKPSWQKIFSDLWENKVRTILVVASIAVGVFAVGMIAGAYFIIPQDMNTGYATANPVNIDIWTDPFDQEFADAIARMDSVQYAEGRRFINARLKTGPETRTSLELIALSDFTKTEIDRLLPVAGNVIPQDREVIVENKTLSNVDLQIGDSLDIELPDGTKRQLPVVGIVQDVTSGIGGLFTNAQGYVTYDTLEWLSLPLSFNRLYVTVADNGDDLEHVRQVASQVRDKVERSGRNVYRTELYQSNKHPMDNIIQALLGVLLILGVLVVFLSSSLISNTLTALLNQHLQQIGIMKLIGARRSQIVFMYLVLILAFSLLSLVLAIPLGSWAAYELSAFAAGLIGFRLQGYRVVPFAVLLQISIAFLIPLIAGVPPILRGAQITIHQAINNTGMGGAKPQKDWLGRSLGGIRGISRMVLVSLRNTFRHKRRLALTLFTLTLGGAIFISVFNVQVALNKKMEDSTKYFRADINLDFDRSYRIEAIQQHAKNIDGVVHVESWTMTSAEILRPDDTVSDNIAIIAPPADSVLVEPVLLEGRWLLSDDENAITINEAFLRKYPHLKVGDELRLKIGERKETWKIVGIFQFTGMDELFAYANNQYLSRLLNRPHHSATYRLVTIDSSLEYQERLSAQIDNYFRNLGYKVSKVEAGGAFLVSARKYIGVLTAFLIIMALLTALVGSIGLTGTLSMNVLERTREIGVLRAIGAYNTVVFKLVIIEGLVIGVMSYCLAIILSFPITHLLSQVVSQAIFNSPANFAFTIQGFLIWFGVVFVLTILASVAPARNATRMTIREVLAYE